MLDGWLICCARRKLDDWRAVGVPAFFGRGNRPPKKNVDRLGEMTHYVEMQTAS